MFVARENEIATMKEFLSGKGAMLVYGLRRVGKTSLIKKVLNDENRDFLYFECQKASEEINVSLFVDLLKEKLNFPEAEFRTFLSVFKEIENRCKDRVFVIDEYSYMKQYYLESKKPETKQKAEQIDSEFQNIIDEHLNHSNLILSGSSIHIMEKLLDHNSPVYGRFSERICLRQFSYLDAKKMLPALTNEDFIAFYSVFGGSPYALERVNPRCSLKRNICDLLLKESGKLRDHINHNILNELESDPDLHSVLDAIKNGAKSYHEIESKSRIETSGLLDKRLKKLLELDLIEARFPIGREIDKKKKRYQLKDNLLKFYYAYIFRQDNRISLLGEERYYDLYIAPTIKQFVSRRFENIVRDYFSLAVKRGQYPDIVDIGSFFTAESEFDCVLKKMDGSFAIYEVKYLSKPLRSAEVQKETFQIRQIKGLNVKEIGFASSSGFENRLDGIHYLDLDDIFFNNPT
ncbi:MAG: AAA family ATPase [Bacilli bacterium]|nr:AAA family ATPase [Bacilli bacterium]